MKNLRPLRLGKRRKNHSFKKIIPAVLIIGFLIAFIIFIINLSGTNAVVNYIFSGTSLKSSGGRVNVLLLGIAGGTHAGASLTDTIVVASYNLKEDELTLLSIPRDLWLPPLKSKANAVYQIGLSDHNGLGLSKTVMGNILGIPIHYGLRVDFRGFVQAIDTIDGIDVLVDRSFDDYNYPIEGQENDLCGYKEEEKEFSEEEAKKLNIEVGKRKVLIAPDGSIATDSAEENKGIKYFSCRYEHVRFEKGLMHMSGAVALKFVRSRHGTNGEGSDFARSARQQKVIDAVRKKILSFETLTDPQKISDLVKTLGKSIDMDISVKDAIEFLNLSRKLKNSQSFVLDDRKSLLVHPDASGYGGAFVLISQDDDFSIIHDYVRKILKEEITEYESTASARPGNK